MKYKVNSGDIIRIPLWKGFGFAYARYIDLRLIPFTSMPSLIEVYEYWTKSREFKINLLKLSDFLMQPILVAGIDPVIRSGHWEIVEHSHFDTTGYELPHFKSYEPRWEAEEDAKDWYYIENCNSNRRVKSLYENVKHLESYKGFGTGNIEIKITMQIVKKEGYKIEDYFEINDKTFLYLYGEVLKSPLVSEIPKSMYGKARVC